MSSTTRQRGAGTGPINIRTQLTATHNPLFPFSSPNLDDDTLSLKSSESAGTLKPSSFSPVTNDGRHFTGLMNNPLRAKRPQDVASGTRSRTIAAEKGGVSRKKAKPGLHVITNFTQPQPRSGNVVFNQVNAKQPKHAKNRARSVVSQIGIKVLTSPLPLPKSGKPLSQLEVLTRKKYEKRSRRAIGSRVDQYPNAKQNSALAARSSVVFGLCVPEHEATFLRSGDILDSAVTLITPATPQIVVTPAKDEKGPFADYEGHMDSHDSDDSDESTSPTSLYSKSTWQYYQPDKIEAFTPPLPKPRAVSLGGLRRERRASSDSQEQILPDSSDTARPKSQGWWNLMLSPMLSRAGTLKLQKGASDGAIPPVPPLPSDSEKHLPLQTPVTVMSPETPRRLGLADVRSSTWSRWTDCDYEQDLVEKDMSALEESLPTVPRDYLNHVTPSEATVVLQTGIKGEGLAAEYFHACAVEQLTGTTYFECVNHSCALHLPELRSVYDTHYTNVVLGDITTNGERALQAKAGVVDNAKAASTAMSEASLPVGVRFAPMKSSIAETDASYRDHSPVSPVESEDDIGAILSPNIRQANTAAFSKAKTVNSRDTSPSPLVTAPKTTPKPLTIQSNIATLPSQQPLGTPGPISPEATRAIAPTEAMPMAPLQSLPAESTAPLIAPIPQMQHALVAPYHASPNILYYPYGPPHRFPSVSQQYPAMYQMPPQMLAPETTPAATYPDTANTQKQVSGVPSIQETSVPREVKNEGKSEKRGLGLFGCFSRLNKSKTSGRNNRCRTIFISVVLIIVVILCILFAILFTRGSGGVNPIESQWLNLTGYPPIPTGISTIARPNLVASQNRCTTPTTMWSCSQPKEDQASISPNEPDQPNFRFQIRFRNGTVPANMTIPLGKRADDSSADDLFVPNPSPPGQADQIFLGNTTDNVTKPFEGETTPFFITFMGANAEQSSSSNSSQRLRARQFSSDNPLNGIPAPSVASDGSAAPASLLPTTPFPISQPIKLYNRGQQDEHYGFYIYYDKSIFLSGVSLGNSSGSSSNLSPASADEDGGSTKEAANVRCTWGQTRFKIKMFTNSAFGASLLGAISPQNTSPGQGSNANSSATNFNRPGSFPYPTTILLDRHGGDITKKTIYCYGMNNGNIVSTQKSLVSEIRSIGGTLINPSPQLLSQGNSTFDSNAGGIDGGTGGCSCTWQNWA